METAVQGVILLLGEGSLLFCWQLFVCGGFQGVEKGSESHRIMKSTGAYVLRAVLSRDDLICTPWFRAGAWIGP